MVKRGMALFQTKPRSGIRISMPESEGYWMTKGMDGCYDGIPRYGTTVWIWKDGYRQRPVWRHIGKQGWQREAGAFVLRKKF